MHSADPSLDDMFKDVFAGWLPLIFGVLLCAFIPIHAKGAEPQLKLELLVRGFSSPVFVTAPPGDTNRVFVVEQGSGSSARIRIVDLPTKRIFTTPFITVTGISSGGERGLLGMAFHPGYATNGYFYVNYTDSAGNTEITRFQANGSDPSTATNALASTKTVLLRFTQPESNHNGGWLGFGKDGYLYVASGDGGGADDRHGTIGNGQSRTTLLGKILRIDVDNPDAGKLYGIPEGNPYKGNTQNFREEIWAFGLRNPWRASFDSETGDLWIGDVGQGTREEIDVITAGQGGLNFGWRPREGFIQNPAYPSETPVTPKTDPVFDYNRTLGRSVTGGYVYRGKAIPELTGRYILGDFATARIWLLNYTGITPAASKDITTQINPGSTTKPVRNISSFGEDAEGELYICDYTDGEVYKIVSNIQPVRITNPIIRDNRLTFTFNASAMSSYIIEGKTSFEPGTQWQTLQETTLVTSAGPVNVTVDMNTQQKFIRVRTK